MRSRFADYFNHDEDAAGYDLDVKNESDPIRTGYARALSCIGSRVPADILDLCDSADLKRYDAVVSSYALHHLTPEERTILFAKLASALQPGARIVLVDLM